MIHVHAKTAAAAWRMTCLKLYEQGMEVHENSFIKNDFGVIEVEDVTNDLMDANFPMSKADILYINEYLITGNNEELVKHDWTKIYRKRLFEDFNQIDKIISYLKTKRYSKKGQGVVWNGRVDFSAKIAPCLQLIWFKIYNEKLEIHVHMRAVDCYGKLLMNINEFIALQNYVAAQLGAGLGKYVMFIDSLHFHKSNEAEINVLVTKFKADPFSS
ncbi:MAG: thymidylate synthase [Bacteroidota bacterium]